MSVGAVAGVALVLAASLGQAGHAQVGAGADSLLKEMRALAQSKAGDRPVSIHFIKFAEATNQRSALVEGADTGRVVVSFPVFQVRYPNRWIVIDGGFDRAAWTQFAGKAPLTYWPERWDRVRLALRGADAIVLTHEHWDHAGGVERGAYLSEIAPKAYLTSAQVTSLLEPSAPFYIRIPRDSLPPYQHLEYEGAYPVAPGVVLVKAPGHSPGSQWVFVQLATGTEVLIIGDLVWNMAGLELAHQRPPQASENMKEDREAVQRQLDLVRDIMHGTQITVIPSHDDAFLTSLVRRGVLHADFDLNRR